MTDRAPGQQPALLWLGLALAFALGPAELWRFPHWAAEHGGGAFVLVFAGALLLVCLPLFWAELSLGRRGGPDPVSSLVKAAHRDDRSPGWRWLGYLQLLALWLLATVQVTSAGGQLQATADSLGHRWLHADSRWFPAGESASSLTGLLCWTLIGLFVIAGLLGLRLDRSLRALGLTLAVPVGLLLLGALMLFAGRHDAPLPESLWALPFDLGALDANGIWLAVTRALLVAGVGIGVPMSLRERLPRTAAVTGPACVLAFGVALVTWAALAIGVAPGELAIGIAPVELAIVPAALDPAAPARLAVVRALLAAAGLLAAWVMLLPLVAWQQSRFGLERGTAAMLTLLSVWMLSMVAGLGYGAWAEARWQNLTLHDAMYYTGGEVLAPAAALLLMAYAGSGPGGWQAFLKIWLPTALALALAVWLL
jgi:NSS family neurotransmitter:Na+ symporter